jgi:DNA-binding MarR family transcriptional regulator
MAGADVIKQIVEQWSRERPDLDPSGFEVVGRILVLAEHLKRRVGEALAPLELGLWGFDVLATLRRQGEPFRLTPTELSQATMLTSGAMTNRLDRLEAAGLVRRDRNPDDRRGVHVVLTERGRELVDQAIAVRFDEATDAVTVLNEREREEAAALLAKLLSHLEQDEAGAP